MGLPSAFYPSKKPRRLWRRRHGGDQRRRLGRAHGLPARAWHACALSPQVSSAWKRPESTRSRPPSCASSCPTLERWIEGRPGGSEAVRPSDRGASPLANSSDGQSSGLIAAHSFKPVTSSGVMNGQRDSLIALPQERGGSAARFTTRCRLHLQESLAYLGYREGDFPASEAASRCVAGRCRCFPEITEEQQARVIGTCSSFLRPALAHGGIRGEPGA